MPGVASADVCWSQSCHMGLALTGDHGASAVTLTGRGVSTESYISCRLSSFLCVSTCQDKEIFGGWLCHVSWSHSTFCVSPLLVLCPSSRLRQDRTLFPLPLLPPVPSPLLPSPACDTMPGTEVLGSGLRERRGWRWVKRAPTLGPQFHLLGWAMCAGI